jgi:hypothetical protein
MSRELVQIGGRTALGFVITDGGMAVLRTLAFGPHDSGTAIAFALAAALGRALLFGLLAGLVSAPLAVPWLEDPAIRRGRSSPLGIGLVAGGVAVCAIDLLELPLGLGVAIGFIVLVHLLESTSLRIVRALGAIALVVAVGAFLQTQTYRILRARQTVRFVETRLARLALRDKAKPATIEDLQREFGMEAKLHGIASLERDPWRYDYHYVVDPEDGSHLYLSWGADGLPGPDPAIDPGTPGADIDRRAAMGLPSEGFRPPLKIRAKPLPPSSRTD